MRALSSTEDTRRKEDQRTRRGSGGVTRTLLGDPKTRNGTPSNVSVVAPQQAPVSEQPQATGKKLKLRDKDRPERVPVLAYQVPKRGWPKWQYRLFKLFRRPDKVVKFSEKEVLADWDEAIVLNHEHDHKCYVADIHRREHWLRFLVSKMQLTICFVNVKGGASKTTIAVYVGSVIANLSRRSIFLLPATQATETSTTARYAGIEEDNELTISELAARYEALGPYRSVSAEVPRNPWGLAVISEDPDDKVDVNVEFRRPEFINVYTTLYPSVDTMLLDTGNDTVNGESVPLQVVDVADVMVCTATVGKEATLELVSRTLNKYLTVPPRDGNMSGGNGVVRGGSQIPVAEKALHAITVFSGTRPDETADDYVRYTKRRDRRGNVLGELAGDKGFDGEILTVRHDDYVAGNLACNIEEITLETYSDILNVAIAIYTKGAQLKGIDLGRLTKEAQLKGIALPDPDEVLSST